MAGWLRSYGLLLRWNLLRVRSSLPFLFVIQTLLGVGVAIGFAFLVPNIDRETALYLATGAPTIGLITVGMVAVPQTVAQQKLTGMFDHVRAMPVPRLAVLAADATIWVGITLPGLAAALLVAGLRFDLSYMVSPLVVPAVLLVAACAVALGYGLGYAAKPEVSAIASQLVIIVALMFAPVNYPADRLPGWLAEAHRWLPFTYMAQVVRETVNVPAAGVSVLPFVVLTAWCVGGLLLTYRLMIRRA